MPWIPLEYHYPLFTMIIFGLVLAFVPKNKVPQLFWTSLVWGFFVSVLFVLIFGKLLRLFHYDKADPFTFYESPIWVNVAWLGAVMLYLRFLPTREVWYVFPAYLLVFSFASMVLDKIFHQTGMLSYSGWQPFYRFLASVFLFYCSAKHQWALEKKDLKKGANEER